MPNGVVYINAQGKFASIEDGKVTWVDELKNASLIHPRNFLSTKYPELKSAIKVDAWVVSSIELIPPGD